MEQKKCVVSYVGNHLKPKKNPVCSGSEHKQREEVERRNQRDRAGRGDSHWAKRLARTIREQKKNRKGRRDENITLHIRAHTFDDHRKSKFHFHLQEE